MELFQEILVMITFILAVGYMFTKFVYKPKFLISGKKPAGKACGSSCGSCH